jgi:hypothetical protein
VPAPVKAISWSPSVLALDTPLVNSSVEPPEIVSVPFPVTSPVFGSMITNSPSAASIAPLLVKACGRILSAPLVASIVP